MSFQLNILQDFIVRTPLFSYSCTGIDVDSIIENNIFKEGIAHVSSQLYSSYEKYCEGKLNGKKLSKMQRTLYKYATRASLRCTPFGLFAISGTGKYENNLLNISNSKISIKGSICLSYLHKQVYSHISTCTDVDLENLYVIRNQTIVESYGEIYYYRRDLTGNRHYSKLPFSQLLGSAIEKTQRPTKILEIVDQLEREYDCERKEIISFIRKLIISEILISELEPDVFSATNQSIITYDSISINKVYEENRFSLKNFEKRINQTTNNGCINNNTSLSSSNEENIKLSDININSFFSSTAVLPTMVKDEVNKLITFHLKFPIFEGDSLRTFKQKFFQRYEKMTVPLMEVLDQSTGIGFHQAKNNLSNRKNKFATEHESIILSKFEIFLLRKILENSSDCIETLIINDKDIESLNTVSIQELDIHSLPLSYKAMYKIIGYNDNGPVLSDFVMSGLSAAGILSRFGTQSARINNIINKIIREENNVIDNSKILAEVSCLTNPRYGNIQERPKVREYAILNGTYPSPNIIAIELQDLYLRLTNGRLVLLSKKLGQEIIPCFTSAFNPFLGTDPIYQFLFSLNHQGGLKQLKLQVEGLLEIIRHVPRIMYSNTVLFPETWLVDTEEFQDKKKYSVNRFYHWCYLNNVPRFIKFERGDNYIIIDQEAEISCTSFFDEIENIKKVKLSSLDLMWDNIKHYDMALEVIQPIIIQNNEK